MRLADSARTKYFPGAPKTPTAAWDSASFFLTSPIRSLRAFGFACVISAHGLFVGYLVPIFV